MSSYNFLANLFMRREEGEGVRKMKCIKCSNRIEVWGWWVQYHWCQECAVKYPDEIAALANAKR